MFFILIIVGAFSVFLFALNVNADHEIDHDEDGGDGIEFNGVISGYKFEDVNGNGERDEGEPGYNGWTIWLDNDESVITGDGEGWPDGYYEFTGLAPEWYTVCEESQGNWTQTYPNEDTEHDYVYEDCNEESGDYERYGYDVEIDEDEAIDLDFGNFEKGHISGHKYSEETGDPIEDWTIYAKYPDGDLHYRTTGEDGYYNFDDLGPGVYEVCESIDEDEETCQVHPDQSYPNGSWYTIEMTPDAAGLDNPNYDFRNYTEGRIEVKKFRDTDSDGELDDGEPPFVWNFCLYQINLETFEETLIGCKDTDPDSGLAVWEGLDFGKYSIEEEEKDGWFNTVNPKGSIDIEEGSIRHEMLYGNREREIIVKKFNDKNASWELDEGEPSLSGWEFCLYKIVLPEEGGEPAYELVSPCKTTDAQGVASWTELEQGEYRLDEEERDNWFHTTPNEEGIIDFELEDEAQTHYFGNTNNTIRIQKFWDDNHNGERDGYWPEREAEFIYTEPVLGGWEFCLYKWNDEIEEWETARECKNTDADGWVSWTDLEEGDYKVIETTKEGWFSVNFEDGVWEDIEIENGEGEQTAYFGNDTSILYVYKFYDINQNSERDNWAEETPEPYMRNWQICLYREDEPEEVLLGCKFTDDDGLVSWEGLTPALYKVVEELRGGWVIPGDFGETPHIRFTEIRNLGDDATVNFGNWIEDLNHPVSQFNESKDHEVIDVEMLSLDLAGRSIDQESGVKDATMTIYRLGDEEAVQNYPAQSFFDVFTELTCPPDGKPIDTEMVALSLTSVGPVTVNWNHNWAPPGPGIYCFEAKSKDYADNSEETAWAGPLAYVPVAQISEIEIASENITETSFAAEWQTDKPATSRVIYDTVPHETLGEAPNYGYAFSTAEQDLDPKVTDHLVVVSGLTAGTTYYYRTISAASPESVSGESSTSTDSQQPQQPSGGGGGSMMWPVQTPIPTPTPSTTLTPTPSPEVMSSTANSTQTGGANSTITPTPAVEQLSLAADSANTENENDRIESENNGGQNNSQDTSGSLLAAVGSFFGSASRWQLLLLAIALLLTLYFIFRHKRSKK